MAVSVPDCNLVGHVLCESDPECLACGHVTVQGDKVRIHIDRRLGELADPRSVANIDGPDAWGHAG